MLLLALGTDLALLRLPRLPYQEPIQPVSADSAYPIRSKLSAQSPHWPSRTRLACSPAVPGSLNPGLRTRAATGSLVTFRLWKSPQTKLNCLCFLSATLGQCQPFWPSTEAFHAFCSGFYAGPATSKSVSCVCSCDLARFLCALVATPVVAPYALVRRINHSSHRRVLMFLFLPSRLARCRVLYPTTCPCQAEAATQVAHNVDR